MATQLTDDEQVTLLHALEQYELVIQRQVKTCERYQVAAYNLSYWNNELERVRKLYKWAATNPNA